MNIHVIDAGNFKLDGGAMFGVVPKTIWSKAIPADENNLCNFKMRCLLVEDGNRLTLIDTGMGDKQPQKWQNYYFRNGEGDLKNSIRNAGFHEDEITDVILSHMHFDHCGGAVEYNSRTKLYEPAFSKAIYWTHSTHYETAVNPNPREKATFLTENIMPLQEAGVLKFLDKDLHGYNSNYEFMYVDGHTEGMIMVILHKDDKKVLFAADTVPTAAHVHLPYVMSYDVRPLQTMKEKEELYTKMISEDIIIVYDHDVVNEASKIIKTEKGFRAEGLGQLSDYLNK